MTPIVTAGSDHRHDRKVTIAARFTAFLAAGGDAAGENWPSLAAHRQALCYTSARWVASTGW